MIVEGCYPYVVGGVSSWVHAMIKSFPEHEFIVQTIIANRSIRGEFLYELPENVSEVREIYLDDYDYVGAMDFKSKRLLKLHSRSLSVNGRKALHSLFEGNLVDFKNLFEIFQKEHFSIDDVLMGQDFFALAKSFYQRNYPEIVFTDFLWTLRSIYLPLFFTLRNTPPKADVYHCISTGYAGVFGAMGKHMYPKSKLMISEHGIYTREREEELIKATWVKGVYKNIWIQQFHKLSFYAYQNADIVTCLFQAAKELQVELGCPQEKIEITPNGIDMTAFADIPRKKEQEAAIYIGAVLRVTPIKDVKTMLMAYHYAKKQDDRLRLWIMGSCDEQLEYYEECKQLVHQMKIKDVTFTGRIQVHDYLGKMDMSILTSISEGQPLTILESFAAHVPVIATNVGNCKGMILGEEAQDQAAGIITPIMDVNAISEAILTLAKDEDLRKAMGEIGYCRVKKRYQLKNLIQTYDELYRRLGGDS